MKTLARLSALLCLATVALGLPAGASAQARFLADGDEVTDTVTGLVWRRCSEGQSWTGTGCSGRATRYTWSGALAMAQAVAADGAPWRLPNVKELASIVDVRRVSPAIDLTVFPNTPNAYFWPSTHHARGTEYAWALLFSDGGLYDVSRDTENAVRMVREGP